jgi:hypothetical protein
MKVTIDIADDLLIEARTQARKEGTALVTLLEAGLRNVLRQRATASPAPARFELPTTGDPERPLDPGYLATELRITRRASRALD